MVCFKDGVHGRTEPRATEQLENNFNLAASDAPRGSTEPIPLLPHTQLPASLLSLTSQQLSSPYCPYHHYLATNCLFPMSTTSRNAKTTRTIQSIVYLFSSTILPTIPLRPQPQAAPLLSPHIPSRPCCTYQKYINPQTHPFFLIKTTLTNNNTYNNNNYDNNNNISITIRKILFLL